MVWIFFVSAAPASGKPYEHIQKNGVGDTHITMSLPRRVWWKGRKDGLVGFCRDLLHENLADRVALTLHIDAGSHGVGVHADALEVEIFNGSIVVGID